jgi:hypothetical protein
LNPLDTASRPKPTAIPQGLEPGDLLLYRPRVPDLTQATVTKAQRWVYGAADADYIHVALYGGAGIVHDAAPQSQVSTRPLAAMALDGWLRARRLAGVTSVDQQALCGEATAIIANGARYGRVKAFVHGLLAAAAVLPPNWNQLISDLVHATQGQQERVFYCSGFVQRVHVNAIGFGAWHPGLLAALPATFSCDPKWQDVPLRW